MLALLADGGFHSGADLSRHLGVSRASIRNYVQFLRRHGLEVHFTSDKGYRLGGPLELLDAAAIRASLNKTTDAGIAYLECRFLAGSTNQILCERSPEDMHRCVILAEGQSRGRGRGARRWVSPLGLGLYLSIGWRYAVCPRGVALLSLAASVAAVQALERMGVSGVRLKWPNDLVWQDRKLGGVLAEVRGGSADTCRVVLGAGINVVLSRCLPEPIDRPWTALAAIVPVPPSRNRLASALIDEWYALLDGYDRRLDLPDVVAAWRQYDDVAGREVVLHERGRRIAGKAVGIHEDGSLLLAVGCGVRKFSSREVSLRLVD